MFRAVADPLEKSRFTLQIPVEELDELRQLAERNHRSVGAEIRLAVRDRLKDFENDERREAA